MTRNTTTQSKPVIVGPRLLRRLPVNSSVVLRVSLGLDEVTANETKCNSMCSSAHTKRAQERRTCINVVLVRGRFCVCACND